MKCRSCLSNLMESNYLSIERIGYGTSTFKDMFKAALGYPILPTEPQHFCELCAQRLIEWHKFKHMCQRTQKLLLPIKVEPEECHSETVWCADPPKELQIKLEPENWEDIMKLSQKYQHKDRVEIQCKVFLRPCASLIERKCTPIGILEMTGKSVEEFIHKTWLYALSHLKREVVFDDNGDNPRWHPNERPQEKDFTRFVGFKDSRVKSSFEIPTFNRFLLWQDYQPTVFVYPYSKNVKKPEQWKAIEKTLMNRTDAKEPLKKSCPRPVDEPPKAEPSNTLSQSTEPETKKPRPADEPTKAELSSTSSQSTETKTEKPRPVDEPPKDEPSNTLSQSTETKIEKPKYKHCPFPECTSIVTFERFKPHCNNCRFNPNRVLNLKCPFTGCIRSYAIQHEYNRHIRLCKKNPQRTKTKQQCPHCPAMVFDMKSHIHCCHSKREPFICDTCGAERTSKGGLKRHMTIAHTTTITLICDKCPFEFKSKKSLKYHIDRHHSDKPLELNYKCDQCSYQTHDRYGFNRHWKVRHDPTFKKFTCNECNKQFGKSTDLKGHMETHAESLEFTCEVCSHVSKTRRGLKCHMTLHEEWQYECPVCQLKRRSSNEVRMHCIRKHPDYKQPPKFTVMKTKSRFHGQVVQFFQDEKENK